MLNKKFIIAVIVLINLAIYLFVTAPPPLSNEEDDSVQLPIELVLHLANEENKVARNLYTKDILQSGVKIGIKFSEEWQEKKIIAGLLPAQFLRETATYLEKSSTRLSLYLGSDFPINKVNLIEGLQGKKFSYLKKERKDVFFETVNDRSYVYMSPDVAVAKACVSCHNEHEKSPKSDWKIDDVMGATTWLYPKNNISLFDALQLLSELRKGFKFSYDYFLEEVKQMPELYVIGDKWPVDGKFVPSSDVFMEELAKRASPVTLNRLLSYSKKELN